MANIRWGARMDGTCKYKTIHFISESFVCVNRCITNCQSVCFCSIPNLGFSVLIWGNRRATTNQVTTTTDTSCTVYNHITATNNHIFCNVQSTAQHSWSPPSETPPQPFLFHNSVGSRPTLHHWGACQTNPPAFRWEIPIPHHWGGEHAVQQANDQPWKKKDQKWNQES